MTTKKQSAYDRQSASELLNEAKKLSQRGATWMEANNALFGVESHFGVRFPTPEARRAFHAGPEYAEIRQLLAGLALPHEVTADPSGPSGKFLIRVPKSLHAALQAEAEAEGVSLNQLALAKLSMGLRRSIAG